MTRHFLSLVTFHDGAPPDIPERTVAAAHRLLAGAETVAVGSPTAVMHLDRDVHLVVDLTFADADALETFRQEPGVREFSETYLRPHADVVHVVYDEQ